MKGYTISLCVLALVLFQVTAVDKTPNVNFGMNLELIESIYWDFAAVIAPWFKGKTVNDTFTLSNGSYIQANISNITLTDIYLDPNINIVGPGRTPNSLNLAISNIRLGLSSVFDIHIWPLSPFQRVVTAEVKGMGFDLELTFDRAREVVYTYLSKGDTTLGNLTVNIVNHTAETYLVKWVQYFMASTIESLEKDIVKTINGTLQNITKEDFNLTVLTDYMLTARMYELPVVKSVDAHKLFISGGVTVELMNNRTNQTAPIDPKVAPSGLNEKGGDIQLFITKNLFEQAEWMAFDAKLVDVVANDRMLSADAPLHLNTSFIDILLPGIPAKYGMDKGIYVHISSSSIIPDISMRASKLMLGIHIQMDWWVDNDKALYPQNLTNCTTCELAVSFNATMFISVALTTMRDPTDNSTIAAGSLIDVAFQQFDVLQKNVEVDVNRVTAFLGNAIGAFAPQANPILNEGIKMPANPICDQFKLHFNNDEFEAEFYYGHPTANMTAAMLYHQMFPNGIIHKIAKEKFPFLDKFIPSYL